MGTGYTRKDTANNIDDGNVINAADLDLEFDGIQSAFDNSTGHTHDGTAGEGAPIETIGPAQDVVATASALRPKTDNTVDLGTTALEYKDLFLDGTAHIDTLDVDENASITGTLSVTSTSTFNDDVTFTGANYNVVWDKSGNSLEFRDNAKAVFGNGGDLQIYHNGTNSFIADSGTGNLLLRGNNVSIQNAAGTETVAQFVEDSFVKLFHNNSQKFSTTSTGISVTDDIDVGNNIIMSSDAANISFGADSEIYIKHSHNTGLTLENTVTTDNASFVLNLLSNEDTITNDEQIGRINFSTNSSAGGVSVGTQASIRVDATGTYSSTVAGSTMEFYTTQTDGTLSRAMYIADDQSVLFTGASANIKLDATNDTLDFPDDFKIMMGNSDDLQIFHDGNHSIIADEGTGNLYIQANNLILEDADGNNFLYGTAGADVKLYYNNVTRLQTTSSGLDITGSSVNITSGSSTTTLTIKSTDSGAGDGPILKLYRDSSSPAADDDIARIDFNGENSAGSELSYARIDTFIETPTASSEDGRMRMLVESGGTLQSFIDLDASNGGADGRVGLNLGGLDIDVKMSGDSVGNLFYLDASEDRIGVGTDSPKARLTVQGTSGGSGANVNIAADEFFIDNDGNTGMTLGSSTTGTGYYAFSDPDVALRAGVFYEHTNDAMGFRVSSQQRMRIDSGGDISFYEDTGTTAKLFWDASSERLILGNTTIQTLGGGVTPNLQLQGTSSNASSMGVVRHQATASGPLFLFAKSRASSLGDTTIVQNGDQLGRILFSGADGTDVQTSGAAIQVHVDGTPGANDMPARIAFQTTADGESSPTERMTINRQGRVGIGTNSPEDRIHIVAPDANDAKIKLENETSPRGNYIGMENSDELVIAADEDNIGTGSNIRFRVDAAERMRIEDNGRVAIFADGIAQQDAQSELHILRADVGPARIRLQRAGSNTEDESIGELQFYNNDGSNDGANVVAKIAAEAYTGSGSGGQLSFFTHDATEGGEGSDPVRRMVIHGNGRVGIGEFNPEAMLHINGGLYSTVPNIFIENGSSSEGDITWDSGEILQMGTWNQSTDTFNERLTIHNNGDVNLFRTAAFEIGRNEAASTYDSGERGITVYAGASNHNVILFARNVADGSPCYRQIIGGTTKAEIEANGDFLSATDSYAATSDGRLKENIVASGSQWEDIKALQIKKYSFIEDGLDAPDKIGVIAQDLLESGMSGLVKQKFTTDADDNPVLDADGNQEYIYAVKTSVLHMKAVKALQEAIERIETLETENTAIKARLDALEAT